jgi:hypothetical protein
MSQDVANNFLPPLSMEASQQLQSLISKLSVIHPNDNAVDRWFYIWGQSFVSKKAYISIVGLTQAPRQFAWLWKSSNRGCHIFFFWLLLLDRLNTRNLLHRKNFHLESYSCVLCNTAMEETLDHLFFDCPFSAWCWSSVGIVWDTSLPIMDRLEFTRAQFGLPIFMEIVILTA